MLMRLVVFGCGDEDSIAQLESVVPGIQLEVCNSLASLCSCLRKFEKSRQVAVLICGTREILLQISALEDLLANLRIVLVVPDLEETTLVIAHRLFPRYLTTPDNWLYEVKAILPHLLNVGATT